MGLLDSLFGKKKVAISGALGSSTNPVRCFEAAGERDYLDRLRWKDGYAPDFKRAGSFGTGPYGNILDMYRVSRPGHEEDVFFDMYHKDFIERTALAGWHICNLRTSSKAYPFDRAVKEDAESLRRHVLRSLPVETCKELMECIVFCIGKLGGNPKMADLEGAVAEFGIASQADVVRAVRFVCGGNRP